MKINLHLHLKSRTMISLVPKNVSKPHTTANNLFFKHNLNKAKSMNHLRRKFIKSASLALGRSGYIFQ
jgi:hypothetical protein